jgi:hypothetical protein
MGDRKKGSPCINHCNHAYWRDGDPRKTSITGSEALSKFLATLRRFAGSIAKHLSGCVTIV